MPTRFIVTDYDGKPMAWSADQLCYCTDEYWQDEAFMIKTYTEKTARNLIEQTIRNRSKWGMEPGRYKLMPIYLPKKLLINELAKP